jgi:hypothetical protein
MTKKLLHDTMAVSLVAANSSDIFSAPDHRISIDRWRTWPTANQLCDYVSNAAAHGSSKRNCSGS